MGEPFTGGCACGAIRYEIAGEPIVGVDCQCRDCQRESGTGHASHLVFARQGARITGEASLWEMVADSGNVKTRAFCPACGSPIYMTFAATPDVLTIRAGSLDDPGRYRPQMITYAMRGHAFDCLDPGIPKFERMPPA